MDTIRVAAVGLGESFQKIHLPIIRNLPMFHLVEVFDTDVERAEQIASQIGCERADTLQAVLSNQDIQGIIVCTPPSAQLSISLQAVEASKYVLCEKPLGFGPITLKSNNYKLFPFLPYLDSPIGEQVLKFSADNPIKGMTVIFGHNGVGIAWKPRTNWYFDRTISGGGVLLDLGSHLLPLLPLLKVDLSEFKKQMSSKTSVKEVEVDAVLTKPGFYLRFSWELERSSELMVIEYETAPSVIVDFRTGILIHAQEQMYVPTTYGARSYILWAQTILSVPTAVKWTQAKLGAVKEVRQWFLHT
jgi:Oxidoreductase family, NAD-binding Rossmann fold